MAIFIITIIFIYSYIYLFIALFIYLLFHHHHHHHHHKHHHWPNMAVKSPDKHTCPRVTRETKCKKNRHTLQHNNMITNVRWKLAYRPKHKPESTCILSSQIVQSCLPCRYVQSHLKSSGLCPIIETIHVFMVTFRLHHPVPTGFAHTSESSKFIRGQPSSCFPHYPSNLYHVTWYL